YESTDGGAGVFINCDHRVCSSAGGTSGACFAVPSISASSAVAASATADAPAGCAAGPRAVSFPPQHSQNCADVSDWDSHAWQRTAPPTNGSVVIVARHLPERTPRLSAIRLR